MAWVRGKARPRVARELGLGVAVLPSPAAAMAADDFVEQTRLLAALARSPCALELTGKSHLYWRRMENACWRSRSVQQQQRTPQTLALG